MEVLDKGKHCEEEFCHQLDLLPMQCKACKKFFCSDHFKYEEHKCKAGGRANYVIPTCDICKKTIEFSRHKDLDLCLAEHLQECLNLNQRDRVPKNTYKSGTNSASSTAVGPQHKKCSFKNCKSKEVFRFQCDRCIMTYCNKHRLPEIHSCDEVLEGMRSKMLAQTCSRQFNSRNNTPSNTESSKLGFKKLFSF
jgi:hypothetical protein